MLTGNCPIQLDGYVCTAWGGVTCALRAGLVEAFGALKKRRSKVLEGIDCRNKVRSRIQNNHKIGLLFNR